MEFLYPLRMRAFTLAFSLIACQNTFAATDGTKFCLYLAKKAHRAKRVLRAAENPSLNLHKELSALIQITDKALQIDEQMREAIKKRRTFEEFKSTLNLPESKWFESNHQQDYLATYLHVYCGEMTTESGINANDRRILDLNPDQVRFRNAADLMPNEHPGYYRQMQESEGVK